MQLQHLKDTVNQIIQGKRKNKVTDRDYQFHLFSQDLNEYANDINNAKIRAQIKATDLENRLLTVRQSTDLKNYKYSTIDLAQAMELLFMKDAEIGQYKELMETANNDLKERKDQIEMLNYEISDLKNKE